MNFDEFLRYWSRVDVKCFWMNKFINLCLIIWFVWIFWLEFFFQEGLQKIHSRGCKTFSSHVRLQLRFLLFFASVMAERVWFWSFKEIRVREAFIIGLWWCSLKLQSLTVELNYKWKINFIWFLSITKVDDCGKFVCWIDQRMTPIWLRINLSD